MELTKPFDYVKTICMSDIRNYFVKHFALHERIFSSISENELNVLIQEEKDKLQQMGFCIFNDLEIQDNIQELKDLLIKKDLQISSLQHNVSQLQRKLNKLNS